MNNLLVKCPHCKRIFKIVKTQGNNIVTDFNDTMEVNVDNFLVKCLCGRQFNFVQNTILTEDWIADLFYKVKG